jgi:hypothetical protein
MAAISMRDGIWDRSQNDQFAFTTVHEARSWIFLQCIKHDAILASVALHAASAARTLD